MNLSIKNKIYCSFFLLVFLFVANGIASIITLNNSRKLSKNISRITDPSLEGIENFEDMLIDSKMYTTNWVFLRSSQEDKDALKKLHASDYPRLKRRLNLLSSKWDDKTSEDSLSKIFIGFEQLLVFEKEIMASLQKFNDYDDPVKKLEAEGIVEDELLPRTSTLMNALIKVEATGQSIRTQKGKDLEESFMFLRMLISVLAITIIFIGIFLSLYMARVIISPINKIRDIINDLGKGIIRKVEHHANSNEIGKMVYSVNNLSEKLQATASFAHEVGIRNFTMPFQPLSDEDTLGKALITMRNNLSASERQLLDANAEIQIIFDAVLDAVIIIDEKGKIVKWDHKSEILFGWKKEEMIGTPLTESIIPHRFRGAHQRGMKEFLKTGEGPILGKTIEVTALKKDKEEFDISLSISPSRAGNKFRFIGFVRDISSRKKAEAELRLSEERYRQIVETAQEGIWLIDENHQSVFVNKKMGEILEYPVEDMLGKYLFDFMDGEGKAIATTTIESQQQRIEGSYEFKFVTKNGKHIWTNIATTSIFGEDKVYKGALAMVTDITHRKSDEELLKRSEANLELKNRELEQKNKELEQFAYVASHDMQEPLRTTSSFVELLRQQYHGQLDEKADKYLNYIIQASDRMKILINDLLDYSRIGKKKEWEQVDSNIILQDVLADLDVAIKESNAEINSSPLPVINGYPTEIKQLFQNLVMNAVKFRKKNIIPQIKIDAQRNNGHWKFEIADNGIGIEEQHKERIFVIFQRLHTRKEYEGSGIGLAHCKKIVELHGGKIWVESLFGEGTTFHFTLPAGQTGIPKNNNL